MYIRYSTLLNTSKAHLNDLWRYRVNDSTWTWISGSSITDQPGVYGEKGDGHIDNVPGARYGAGGWYDSDNAEFWLFGGYGYGNSTDKTGV